MKLLILWHEFPSPYWGAALPLYNLLRYFSDEYKITLICFRRMSEGEKWKDPDISDFVESINTVELELPRSLSLRALPVIFKNMILHTILGMTVSICASPYYSRKMAKMIKNIQKTNKFDMILTSSQMAFYVKNSQIPKIVLTFDARSENYHLMSKNSKKFLSKLIWTLLCVREKFYESNIYKRFDACIVVTERDKRLLERHLKNVRIEVIPNGVDIEYFKPKGINNEPLSIVFIGSMSQRPNIDAVLRFYKEIFPIISKQEPNSKLYIVGSNPGKEILELTSDDRVIVTGFVEDVRPFLERASVVIAPMFYGVGIKNKILEAMAMGKPIVTTSNGIAGIEVMPNKEILIADNPEEYARKVLTMLQNSIQREDIGKNARKLVEENYSWSKIAARYKFLIREIIQSRVKNSR